MRTPRRKLDELLQCRLFFLASLLIAWMVNSTAAAKSEGKRRAERDLTGWTNNQLNNLEFNSSLSAEKSTQVSNAQCVIMAAVVVMC